MTPYKQEDDDYGDPPPEPIQGDIQGASGVDLLAEDLLNGIQLVVRLSVLLAEAAEDEFRAVSARLKAFMSATASLPTEPRTRRKMGFKPRKKKHEK